MSRKSTQLVLIFFGSLLILVTYFLYPKFNEKKILETSKIQKDPIKIEKEKSNIFQNVEYEGFYHINNPFTVKSTEAYILEKESNIVYMSNMTVVIFMKDGSEIKISSDKGRYDKSSYDCYFEENVRATDGETTVLSDNLDLLATEDWATVYNNVYLDNESGTLKADKIDYDFEKKYYQISMYGNKKVKIKLIE